MYYKLTKSGIERYPREQFNAQTLFISLQKKAHMAGEVATRVFAVCDKPGTPFEFELDDYYPAPDDVLIFNGKILQMDLDFKFSHDLGKHEAFKLTIDASMKTNMATWQITVWSKPSTNIFNLEYAINNAIMDLLHANGFKFDGLVSPVQLTRAQYAERYIQAKARVFN